ncbi:hypothetical protein FisN_4Hh294 [Fistulifera solaris]|uniref:Pre-rRNA-processing protein RIX1 n=1 Tax=Fistulifera solaris TaxID=1519565 RepID=A0A1Z5KEU8_FISSO|nr:hypothetical protein FisN_4Hh294 [Fistulifera solaris]|eukprot:GAX24736.1 hypothetical protein FisN_4Hh294 [Fistulifera solaris]
MTMIQPPLPTDALPTGQEVLRLLRLYEKNIEDCDLYEPVVDALQLLISTISRRGTLFYHNHHDAQTVLENASTQSTKRGGNKSSKSDERSSQGPTVDAQLIVSAILRILSSYSNHQSSLLVALAADLINTICQTVRTAENPDTSTIASFEIMGTLGKQLLQQLATVETNAKPSDDIDDEETSLMREAILQSAAALVTLFGIKLARSTELLNNLREWAFKTLFDSNQSNVQVAAARLLTALPSGPRLDAVMSCLMLVLVRTVPTVQPNRNNNVYEETLEQDSLMQRLLDIWISQLGEASDNTERGHRFLNLVHGLVVLGVQLLKRPEESTVVEFNVDLILRVVETMMTFPLTAETSFHGTNKRLRAEYLDGGLLNTIVLARDVANVVFISGLSLFNGLLAMAPPLSYTRKIYQIAHAGLRTTSSASVRQVVDPSSAMQFTGTRRRWLHRSIPARIAAIDSFRSAILTCGPDPQSTLSNGKKSQECSRDLEQSLQYVSGFLLESLKLSKDDLNVNGKDLGEWGSVLDRFSVLTASARCLTSTVIVAGEYLSLNMRNLIESITFECLEQLKTGKLHQMETTCSDIFKLASACAQVPWRDGASSSLSHDVLRTAANAVHGPERIGVPGTEAAYGGSRTCELAMFARIPALSVVRSRPVDENMYAEFSMLSRAILGQMNSDTAQPENLSLKRPGSTPESDEGGTSKKSKSIIQEETLLSAPTPNDSDRQQKHVVAEPVPRAAKVELSGAEVVPGSSRDETAASKKEVPISFASAKPSEMKSAEDSDESDDDLPMIFDGGPDDEDAE